MALISFFFYYSLMFYIDFLLILYQNIRLQVNQRLIGVGFLTSEEVLEPGLAVLCNVKIL